VQAARQLQISPPKLSDIQQIARQQKAPLVQYSILSKTQIRIWVIQPDDTVQFRQTALPENSPSIVELAEQTQVAAVLGKDSQQANVSVVALVQDTRMINVGILIHLVKLSIF